jgi:hypothetical protein
MMLIALAVLMATATTTEVPLTRIVDDAKAVDRVAAVSKHDMPRDLLQRMLTEDIELLRGKQKDGSYQYASYERFEAGRDSSSFSVEATADPEKTTKLEVKGSFVYRLIVESPSRRMLVTKNRPVFLDRAEIEYIPVRGGASRVQSVAIRAMLEPGAQRAIDFEDVAKQATVRLFARTDKENGYGNLTLSLVRARISDNPDSPYADAVASAKAILRALDHDDTASMRSMAQRMVASLQPAAAPASSGGQLTVTAPRSADAASATDAETLAELQAIEDLLTGAENERRQGLDRLHQLIRKLRPTPR